MNNDRISNLADFLQKAEGIITHIMLEDGTSQLYFWHYKTNQVSKHHEPEKTDLQSKLDAYYKNKDEPKIDFMQLDNSTQEQLKKAQDEQTKNLALAQRIPKSYVDNLQ